MRTTGLSTVQGPASASSQAPLVPRTVGQRAWVGISSAGAVVLGVLPHVLHHVGLFAGALFAGVGGSLVFGAVGFLATIPFLLRVHRRTGTWRVPAALLTLFAVIFSISTFVIGPAITTSPGEDSPASEQTRQPTAPDPTERDIHHGH